MSFHPASLPHPSYKSEKYFTREFAKEVEENYFNALYIKTLTYPYIILY